MTPSPLQDHADQFLRYLKVERQLSPLTVLNYARQLNAIIALLDAMTLTHWRQCDAAMVRSIVVRSRRSRCACRPYAVSLTGWSARVS